jgi:thiamine pyrophosphokinase
MAVSSRAAVFLNGFYDTRRPDFYAAAFGRGDVFAVCADGGLFVYSWINGLLSASFAPDLVVGDSDSLDTSERRAWESRGVRFATVVDERAAKEDYTDGQLALYAALGAGHAQLDIYGALPTSGCYDHDHFLGNLLLLVEAYAIAGERPAFSARISDPYQAISLCRQGLTLTRQDEGRNRVSLLPWGGPALVRHSEGLRWALRDFALATTRANAVRNEFLPDAQDVRIELYEGSAPVLVVQNWGPGDAASR